jgi:hypothetical protein
MNALATNYSAEIEQITRHITEGIESWHKAGKIVADLLDRDAEAIEKICEACPMVTPGILKSLARIGRSELMPERLVRQGIAYAKLRELPISMQKKYIKEPIPVLIQTANGPDTLNVTIDNLTPKQARQVFSSDGVRDLAAQRAWIADNTFTILPEAESLPYEVHGKTVVFTRPCKLTRSDLHALLSQVR